MCLCILDVIKLVKKKSLFIPFFGFTWFVLKCCVFFFAGIIVQTWDVSAKTHLNLQFISYRILHLHCDWQWIYLNVLALIAVLLLHGCWLLPRTLCRMDRFFFFSSFRDLSSVMLFFSPRSWTMDVKWMCIWNSRSGGTRRQHSPDSSSSSLASSRKRESIRNRSSVPNRDCSSISWTGARNRHPVN